MGAQYNYRVMLTHPDCLAKRPVFFQHKEELDFSEAAREGIKNLSSQNCARCGKAHPESTYVMTDCQRAEPAREPEYRNLFPARSNQ